MMLASVHSKADYGELSTVLDAAFRHYTRADNAAAAQGYRNERLNQAAERRAASYARLKDKARKLRMRA